MKSKLNCLLGAICRIFIFMIVATQATFGGTEKELFDKANKYYMDQAYEKAVQSYEELITSKHVSAEVYYNLGNAYYKSGNIASAIFRSPSVMTFGSCLESPTITACPAFESANAPVGIST